MNALAVTAADAMADPDPLAAELVTRWCGTRAPGVLDLLDMLGIDLAAGAPQERPDPVPVNWPDTYRRTTKGRRQQ